MNKNAKDDSKTKIFEKLKKLFGQNNLSIFL